MLAQCRWGPAIEVGLGRPESEEGDVDDRWFIDGTPSKRFGVYSRANTGEVLPDPASPLGWTLTWLPGVIEGWADGHVWLGTYDRSEFGSPPEVADLFGGYLYINVSVARVYGERTPGASAQLIDDVFFGDHPDVPPYQPDPRDHSETALARVAKTLEWVLGVDDLPELHADRAEADRIRAGRPNLAGASNAQLVAHARSLVPVIRRFFERHFVVSAMAAIGPGVIASATAPLDDPTLGIRLVGGIGDVDSAAPSFVMWDLSRIVRADAGLTDAFSGGVDGLPERVAELRSDAAAAFRAGFADLLERFGSRGPNEWDIYADTWGTRPELALTLIDRMRIVNDDGDPRRRAAELANTRVRTEAEVLAALDPADAEQLVVGIRSAQVFLAGRERTKTNIIRVMHEVRLATRELGRRFAKRGVLAHPRQLYMLLDEELDGFLQEPARFVDLLAGRESTYLSLYDLEPPFVVYGTAPTITSLPRRSQDATPVRAGEVLTGGVGCAGVVTGRARVVLDPADPAGLEPGDILVAPVTDPSWTPLFVTAGGAVVNVGAMGSHAIIVSRELGIPCVVSVKDATKRIPDGATVTVDGARGTVTIVALP